MNSTRRNKNTLNSLHTRKRIPHLQDGTRRLQMRERRLSRAQAIMLLTRSIFHKKLRKQGMLIRAFLAHFFFIYARIFRKCVICNLQDSSMEFGTLECRSASHTEKILSWLRKRESYKLFLKKRLRVFIIIFFLKTICFRHASDGSIDAGN